MVDEYCETDQEAEARRAREPKLIYCTVREGGRADNPGEVVWDLECRFEDGQKFAAVETDGQFEGLAGRIRDLLNAPPASYSTPIPVTERMPDVDSTVLAFDAKTVQDYPYGPMVAVGWLVAKYCDQEYFHDTRDGRALIKVTHWMPIPEAP